MASVLTSAAALKYLFCPAACKCSCSCGCSSGGSCPCCPKQSALTPATKIDTLAIADGRVLVGWHEGGQVREETLSLPAFELWAALSARERR